MIEEFKSTAWKDFQQRYQGVYGWFEKENKSQLLVQLNKVSDTELVFSDKNKIKFYAKPDQGNCFSFLPVVKGVYNTPTDIVYVKRIPAKQYRRGICEDNTGIISLMTKYPLHVSFELLEQIYGEKDTTPLKRFKAALSGNVAFDNVFSLVNNILYVYDIQIGVYANKEFILSNNLFQQETTDLCTRNQLPFVVSVK